MSLRGWGGSVGLAAGVAAGAGAAQAGLGYGLGVLLWPTGSDAAADSAWLASLTWAVWIAASATVVGALGAARLATSTVPSSGSARFTWPGQFSWPARCALALAGAVGGILSVLLVAVPARVATGVAGSGAQTSAAGYALAGVALGLLVAIWALSSPAVARNLVATIGWLWVLAVTTVVVAVAAGRTPGGARLGNGPDWATGSALWFRDYLFWPTALLALGAAFVIGAVAAWPVARHPDLRVGATIAGGVGPAVVAAAHLVVPGQDGLSAVQLSAHLAAPYAVLAGLAGSALAAGVAQRRTARAIGGGDHLSQPETEPRPDSDPHPDSDSHPEAEPRPDSESAPASESGSPSGSLGGVPDQRTSSGQRD